MNRFVTLANKLDSLRKLGFIEVADSIDKSAAGLGDVWEKTKNMLGVGDKKKDSGEYRDVSQRAGVKPLKSYKSMQKLFSIYMDQLDKASEFSTERKEIIHGKFVDIFNKIIGDDQNLKSAYETGFQIGVKQAGKNEYQYAVKMANGYQDFGQKVKGPLSTDTHKKAAELIVNQYAKSISKVMIHAAKLVVDSLKTKENKQTQDAEKRNKENERKQKQKDQSQKEIEQEKIKYEGPQYGKK